MITRVVQTVWHIIRLLVSTVWFLLSQTLPPVVHAMFWIRYHADQSSCFDSVVHLEEHGLECAVEELGRMVPGFSLRVLGMCSLCQKKQGVGLQARMQKKRIFQGLEEAAGIRSTRSRGMLKLHIWASAGPGIWTHEAVTRDCFPCRFLM